MLEARTAWAIALLLAPTGVAVAVTAPAQHTTYVQLRIAEEPQRTDLVAVEARIACQPDGTLGEALDWLESRSECRPPPGAAIYVTNAKAPHPSEADEVTPTGKTIAYEDEDRVWTARELAYTAGDGEQHHAYVLAPDIAQRTVDEARGDPVRGAVDLDKLGIGPGERGRLETTLAAGPQATAEDPEIEYVDADAMPSLNVERSSSLTG